MTMVFVKGQVSLNKGKKASDETRKKQSESHMGQVPWNKGKPGLQTAWNKGLTKETDKRVAKISATKKGIHVSPNTEFKKGHRQSIESRKKMSEARKGWKPPPGFLKGRIPWNKGKTGVYSEEHLQKMSKTSKDLFLKDGRTGHKGGLRHQELVIKTANSLRNDGHKVEVEKAIRVGDSWRIIDVLVDDNMCYEIGSCNKDKIHQLETNGYKVVHLPYKSFEGVA